jgi:serine/threonine protein kinase
LDADGRVKIIDFGLACLCDAAAGTLSSDFVGSPLYTAPEILERQPYAPHKIDVWALGVIFYVMMYGRFPFYAQDKESLFARIRCAKLQFPDASSLSADVRQLIRRMLSRSPQDRPSVADVLADPWFSRGCRRRRRRRNIGGRPQHPYGGDDDDDFTFSSESSDSGDEQDDDLNFFELDNRRRRPHFAIDDDDNDVVDDVASVNNDQAKSQEKPRERFA